MQVIITAANTVSRASVAVFGPPETISVTISATSITVTATASTSEPNGSPTRWAITSAWWTDGEHRGREQQPDQHGDERGGVAAPRQGERHHRDQRRDDRPEIARQAGAAHRESVRSRPTAGPLTRARR